MKRIAALLLLTCWLAQPLAAYAQESTPTPPPQNNPGPSIPSAGDIAGALVQPIVDGLSAFVLTLPSRVGLWIQTWLDSLIDYLWNFQGRALSELNIITNLPPQLTYNLQAVQNLRARMTVFSWSVWGLAAVCWLLVGGCWTMAGRPWTAMLPGFGRLLLAGAAVKLAPAAMAGWIDLFNALANAFLAPGTMLPGSGNGQVSSLGAGVAEITAAVLFLIPATILFFGRVSTLVWVDLLLVIAPVALVLWAMPFPLATRFGEFWANQFFLHTIIQVFLAVVLALADGLVGAAGAMTGANDAVQRLMVTLLYCGLLWTAFRLPSHLGVLAHNTNPVRAAQGAIGRMAVRAMAAL